MSDQGHRMLRLHHHLLTACGVIMILLAGCRGTLDQAFTFEPVEQQLASGGTISLVARGESTTIDSAGVLIERSGSPYWVAVYVNSASSVGVPQIKDVRFVSMVSRTSVIPTVPATEVLSDGETRFVQFRAVELPFEDHEVLVSLEKHVGGRTQTDSVRLYLRKHVAERRVSFWEWLTHL